MERNPKTVQSLTATVTEVLGVPADRVFMNLDDIAASNWGAQGTTVDKLQI
jgi:phenylpyruvate tautomerase PptA (4-oxalocrotonate tautomerase family)